MSYPDPPIINISDKDILLRYLDSFDSTTDDDTLLSVGAIAGIAVGAVVVIVIMLVVTIYCCCRIRPL